MYRLKYKAYTVARRLLPGGFRRTVGASTIMSTIRDRFFRPAGVAEVVEGPVLWEDLELTFHAPYQVLYRAQRRGVENRICRLARSILRQGATAIDVGANYGFVSLVMGKSVGSDGKVISFEIDSRVRQTLALNLGENGLSKRSVVVSAGAGCQDAGGLVRVDSIVERQGVDNVAILKVDVDGGDLQVLRGAEKTLRKHRPVVVIEMTESELEIFQFLRDLGYSEFMNQSNGRVEPGVWPPNLIASFTPVRVPPSGFFTAGSALRYPSGDEP